MTLRRTALTALTTFAALGTGALVLWSPLASAQAQGFPSKPLRIIVPFAPGGVTDMVGRTMAQGLTAELGQTVIVENRAGASGIPGAELAAKADPDGNHFLLLAG